MPGAIIAPFRCPHVGSGWKPGDGIDAGDPWAR